MTGERTFPAMLPLPPEAIEIAEQLEAAGHETWCVGGAVRDALLGGEGSDVDFATAATPEQVQALFPHTVPVGIAHGTVAVLDRQRHAHEVTTFRRDVATDGRHAVVAYGVSLEEDLARRDFTVNAIAYHPLRQEWRDPQDGLGDLARRRIRAVGDPAQRFREDYLRILRALRFAARFGFEIDPATWQAACAAAPGLRQLSAERVRDEWFKGLLTARTVGGFVQRWHDSGAAGAWLPELRAIWAEPNPALPRDAVVLTALLCTAPADVLRRLRASNQEISRAAAMDRGPSAPGGSDALAARRWLAAVGAAADDLLLLARYTGGDVAWAAAVHGVRARGEATDRQGLAVSGEDLRGIGLSEGPAVGRALHGLLELVLADPSLNTRETLLARARTFA